MRQTGVSVASGLVRRHVGSNSAVLLGAKGVKLLAVWTHGPGQMFTKKTIKTLDDFKNLKIRTGGGISAEVISALGGSPNGQEGIAAFRERRRPVFHGR